ncbi:hypothetical protein EV11_1031 [Prochlorococcus sp. SS52]|nr:hypothetical protein EV11_1031 [Prochlorococcus sp. SS52]
MLILALVAPIALPAGGANRNKNECVYSQSKGFYFAGDSCFLLSSPSLKASSLRNLEVGTPLKILRIWENEEGESWAQVKLLNYNLDDISTQEVARGWISV